MRHIIFSFAIFTMVFTFFSAIRGAEHFSIQVYTGAQLDSEETNFIREKGGANSYCYRTHDSVKKAVAFYEKQPGLTSMGITEKGGMFVKKKNGQAVYVKVQSTWQPLKGGKMKNDAIIVISSE